MKFPVKKILLAGTAAASLAAGASAHAATVTFASTGPYNTASTGANGTTGATPTDGAPGGQFNAADPGITATVGATLTGGAGAMSTTAGGQGSVGGAAIDFNADNGTSPNPTTLILNAVGMGGHGAAGTAGTTTPGGSGGAGGVSINDNANFTSITVNALANAGVGGIGGNSMGANVAGAGGDGGNGITVTGSNAAITVNNQVDGDNGGNGGNASGSGSGGAGGKSGDGVSLGGANASLTVSGNAFVYGASGGNGGTSGSGIGGAGGNGGSGIATSSSDANIMIDHDGGILTEDAGTGGTGVIAGAAGVAGNAIQFRTGTTGAVLTNHGYIGYDDGNGGIALLGNAGVTSITNATDGEIEGVNTAALNIGTGTTLGTLINSGIILGDNSAGLSINGAGTLTTLTDNVGSTLGLIQSGSASGDANAALVLNSTAQGALTNTGVISNNGGGVALAFTANTPGIFTNAAGALITSQTGSGMTLAQHTAIDFGATGTVVNNGTIMGNITTSGNALPVLTNSGNITGNVEVGSFLGGTVNANGGTITGTVTVEGGIGAPTLNLNGGHIVGATVLYSDGVINVGSNYTTGGAITSYVSDLNVTAGTFNVQNEVNLDIGALGTGAITNAGTIRLGAGQTLTAGTQNAGGAYVFDVASNSNFGKLALSGGNVKLTNANTSVNVIGSPTLTNGGLLQIASGSTTAAVTNGVVADNSALYNFTLESGTTAGQNADDAYLLVAALSAPAAARAGMTGNEYNAFTALNNATSTDPDFTAVQASVQDATTNRAANRDLEKAGPTTDGGSVQAAVDATNTLFDLTDQQLASLRTDDATTGQRIGMAAGDHADGLRSWAEAFGGHADQGGRNGNAGYNSNTGGGAFGADSQGLFDDSVVGLSFAYGHTHVDNDIDQSTQVNDYQATAYGSHYLTSIDKGLFVEGMAAVQYGRNDETRNDIGGVAGLHATGNYNSYEGAGRAKLGRDFNFHDLGGVTLTPGLITDYTYYHQEGYSESGAGGASLNVGSNSENVWNVGLGSQATWLFKNDNGSYFKPDLHASYKHDLLNDNAVDVSSTFATGGPGFTTDGLKPGRDQVNAGFDARFYSTQNWEFTGSYDYTWKQQYSDNTGLIRAAYKF